MYRRAADRAGMTEEESLDATLTIAANPQAGDLIVGTGGCRKVRGAGRGRGKSGGYRVITYLYRDGRVFLMTVVSKGQRADLTQAERNGLAALVQIVGER